VFLPPKTEFKLRGVGKQTAKQLARLKIFSVEDLLWHLPVRYQDRTHIEPIRHLIFDNEAVVQGVIKHVSSPLSGRTKFLCELKDETGVIYLRFFHVLPFQLDVLKVGVNLRCYGVPRLGQRGIEMVHPEYQVMTEDKPMPVDQHLTPIYPATEGLSQSVLRKLTLNALTSMQTDAAFRELLPLSLLQSLAFPTLKEALQFVHRPPEQSTMPLLLDYKTVAQKRLVFEELLAHRISLLKIKQAFQSERGAPFVKASTLLPLFLANLPFQLTSAQERVIAEIQQDLFCSHPMLRLVQGDVGSGKTVVAAVTMLQAVENGYQAAMMVPTELLADQHYRVFSNWFEALGIKVTFLSGNVKGRARKIALSAIQNGEAQVIIGTHALFQESVNFSALALVITDEQHRFGVHQRASLREKGPEADFYPHQLMMTATPIPRTLAMSFYADMDCSVIDELPKGRTPVTTNVIASNRRDEVIARIREACHHGRQVYWVCPLIDESEAIACQAVTKTAEALQLSLPDLKIGLIHGRMRASDKEATMRAFQQSEINLLVATTVIEVGVDVANASVMIIENAERLGLSQLHQLRGRVGRGAVASHCILLYQQPLSELARQRLAVMRETTDGFKIAERDLELRGPGEVLGTRQTGELSFRVADLMRDRDVLQAVHKTADVIMQEHVEITDALILRWVRCDKVLYS